MADPCADLDLDTPVDASAAISERDIALVQTTWSRAAGLGAETVGKVLFMQILSIAPDAIGLFPFSDYPKERLYKVGSPLVDYGAKVVNTLNVAIGMLNDLPALVPILKTALPELFPGAQKEHYGVVGQAALNSLAIALGGYWKEPVKNAWLKIWTIVVSVIFPSESDQKAKADAEASAKLADEEAMNVKLSDACTAGDWEEAKRLISEGACSAIMNGSSALSIACDKGQTELMKLLLNSASKEDKANLDKKLFDSVQAGKVDQLKALLASGLGPDSRDAQQRTPLILATSLGKVTIAKLLLERNANKDAKGKDGKTACDIACAKGNGDLVELLVSKGAKAPATFKDAKKVLEAAEKGDLPKMKLLLACGSTMDAKDDFNEGPLHKAAIAGHVKVLELMLKKNPSLDVQGGEFGGTPLYVAAKSSKFDAVKVLIEAKSNMEATSKKLNDTALGQAVKVGNMDIVKYLIGLKANIEAADRDDETPLHLSARNGRAEIAKFLLDNGAKKDAKSSQDKTPLQLAKGDDVRKLLK